MSHPQLWPGWDTVRTLGSGSCGTVYEIQKSDGSGSTYRAALKVIRVPQSEQDLRPYLDSGCDNDAIQAIFRRQADEIVYHLNSLRSLYECPHIAGIEDHRIVPCETGLGWEIRLRMRMLTPVTAYLIKNGLNERQVLRLGTELSYALDAAAAKNIRHGGIKPENIFADDDGNFLLADFGMNTAAEILAVSPAPQTVSFLAPELAQGKTADLNADLYSLGLVLYWLLNNCTLPFLPNQSAAQDPQALKQAQQTRLGGKPLPLPAHGRKIVSHSILAACEYDPEVRFTTASAFRTALQSCQENAAPMAVPAAVAAAPAFVPPVPAAPVVPAVPPVPDPVAFVPPMPEPPAPPVSAPVAFVPPMPEPPAPAPFAPPMPEPPAPAPFAPPMPEPHTISASDCDSDSETQFYSTLDYAAFFPNQNISAPVQAPDGPHMIGDHENTYHPGEPKQQKKKISVGLIIALCVLLLALLGIGGYLLYDFVLSPGTSDDDDDDKSSVSSQKDPDEEPGEDPGKDPGKDPGTGSGEDTGKTPSENKETSAKDEKEPPKESMKEEDEEDEPKDEDPEEEDEPKEKDPEDEKSVSYPADAIEWNGHHYYLYDSSAAGHWDDAKIFCEEQGGYLATVSSTEEDEILYELLAESGMKNAYFGYTDLGSEGNWSWANGESASYTNWYPNEPNNYSNIEHYAMYYVGYTDGKWNDDNGFIYSVNSAPISVSKVTASSELKEDDQHNTADRAVDNDSATAWVEGAEGQGTGETLSLNFSSQEHIVAFTIQGGYQSSRERYERNSRPRVIEIRFSDGTVAEFHLEDYFGSQTIYFSRPVKASALTITIKEVYPGSVYDDTAISEISFLSATLDTGFICEWDN